MRARPPLLLATLLSPTLRAEGEIEIPAQEYDYGYQLYQEDDNRIRVEAEYLRGRIELNDETAIRFQYIHDAISGASPTGVLPGSVQPFYAQLEDVREGILGAVSRQFGDHRAEIEFSYSSEDDYISRGVALTDTWELNQKNTTLRFGFNYLDDDVAVAGLGDQDKNSYDLFTGVSQILGKDTMVSANLTLGYAEGYLNDPYKLVQRTTVIIIPGPGGPIEIPVVNVFRENRPDSRFRQVLRLGARHYFEPLDAALDGVVRFSHDDFGILSQTVQIEWRQEIGDHFQAVPFIRYYHQDAADFFTNSLDGFSGKPPTFPDGSGPNYSADYRLSSFDSISGGLRLNYQFNDHFGLSAAYERYVMGGTGGPSERSPDQAYADADIWTFGIHAAF
ncbi:DUF3570 domain-containing protein [Luteolibacter arcticus]|uniref:DUF3570 domain-containing protein n=1 Tax=Luteolibacter arcticus TaxID=1581411 RepID=A0ABT3GPB0_9BACT|nr:DUF3570 domain-containing protein [Luteolibacter arcticus]MCW1925349.1 DUF3570 domain-containing protein [Luteolibacter arcticus]